MKPKTKKTLLNIIAVVIGAPVLLFIATFLYYLIGPHIEVLVDVYHEEQALEERIPANAK